MEKTEWICSNCGTKNDSKFCTCCGAHMPTIKNSMVWICSSCGLENTGKFCTKCGQEKSTKEAFNSGNAKVNLEKNHPIEKNPESQIRQKQAPVHEINNAGLQVKTYRMIAIAGVCLAIVSGAFVMMSGSKAHIPSDI